MLMVEAVTFSDTVLLYYLKSQTAPGEELRMCYEDIAKATGMSAATVYRAMRRLHNAGLISRNREPGDRYSFKVNHDCA
jgi:DNA-binding IclR family transcriptional regulator